MFRIREHSFKSKILFTTLLSTFAALSLTGIGLIFIESWLYEKQLRKDTSALASVIGNRSIAALEFEDQETAQRNLASISEQKYVDVICLYDNSGTLFSSFSRADINFNCKHSGPRAFTSSLNSHLVVEQELLHFGERVGQIAIAANRSYIMEGLQYFVPLLLALIAIVLFLVSLAVKRVLRGITQPLEELHLTAQTLVDDTNSERRVTRCSDDEIGELVEVFNKMLDNLASENLALQTSESRFRTLTANAPIGIFQLDQDNRLTYANDQWYKITATHGSNAPWTEHQNRIAPEFKDEYQQSLNNARRKGLANQIEYQYLATQDSEAMFLMQNIAPLQSVHASGGFIGTLADVSELKTAQQELEKLAYYDPLTGLPNRRFFLDLLGFGLAKSKRNKAKAAVLMLDMDNFKRVNDILGHASGDKLLQQQAERIRKAVREEDAVSRMGGDEFTIMLAPVNAISEVTTLSKRILDELNTPIVIGNHTLEVGASIGVALYPDDGETVEELIKNADMALYEAKNAGRNRVNFFSFKLDLELRESVRIENKLKKAIHNKELHAFIQPQVSGDGTVRWAEALVRWHDDKEGFIPPDKFIPLAEETGLILDLGQWMLEQVCFHLSNHHAYLSSEGIQGISVNLSGRQFYSRTLLNDIRRTIVEHRIPPERLEFELTESAVMDDVNGAIEVMKGIRNMGCKLAIDDFGTGYSSLSYLKRFPINNLKIDRSFVMDIPGDSDGSAIATTIIAMAHKLGLSVVAEGVETEAQRDFLIEQGCELLQGYLFSRPRNIQEFVKSGREKVANVVKLEEKLKQKNRY